MKRGLILPALAAGLLLPAAPAIIKPASAWAAHEKMLLASFLPGMMPGWNRDAGFLPVNLFTKTEQFDNAAWDKTEITVTANTTVAPDGATTAETMNITNGAFHNVRQDVTVLASTQYTFSFHALRGTATDLHYAVYNMNALSFIVGDTSYYSLTNSSTWSRISVTFTTPSGCTLIRPWPVRDGGATGTMFLWGAQLEIGGTMNTYVPVG